MQSGTGRCYSSGMQVAKGPPRCVDCTIPLVRVSRFGKAPKRCAKCRRKHDLERRRGPRAPVAVSEDAEPAWEEEAQEPAVPEPRLELAPEPRYAWTPGAPPVLVETTSPRGHFTIERHAGVLELRLDGVPMAHHVTSGAALKQTALVLW